MVYLQDGYTLMHEHIRIDLSGVKNDLDCRLDDMDAMIEDVQDLRRYGVGNILEVTALSMGRDPAYCKAVADATGVQILLATGFYKDPFLPEDFADRSNEEWVETLLKELTDGVADTGIPASVIGEFGTSKNEMTPNEKRVFAICSEAALRSGAVVTTHTSLGTLGVEQVDYLLNKGLDPRKIIIGHQDLCSDLALVEEVLKRGVSVGFDTVGKVNYQPEKVRIANLLALIEKGYLNHIVLSLDLTRKSQLKAYGGYGRSYLFEQFLPLCKQAGLSDRDIDQLLIHNPRRILSLSKN